MNAEDALLSWDARLIDGRGAQPRDHVAVRVDDGLIVSIEDTAGRPAPDGAVDIGGRTLLPGLRARTAWVLVERHERDAQRFWLSVVQGLRSTVGKDGLVQRSAPTPEFDGEGLVRRLISELEGSQSC